MSWSKGLMGKRTTIYKCPSCSGQHTIWIPGDDYLDGSKLHGYLCPITGREVAFRPGIREAAELQIPKEGDDVEGYEVDEPTAPSMSNDLE